MSTLILNNKVARFHLQQNVRYELRDKFGNIKQLFVENKLGTKILEFIRSFVSNPISSDGQVKSGLMNYLAAYGLRIPFITGVWSDSRLISNLVVSAGVAGVASRINGAGSEAAFTYIAVGIGTTAAAAGNTALESEIVDSGLARAAATASRVTTDVTNDTAQDLYTFSVTGTKAVTESGVLNAGAAGTLLARQVFSAVNVVNGDSLQITWKFDCD
jgi:hypothetical protein